MLAPTIDPDSLAALAHRIRTWGTELGFQQIGFADTDLRVEEAHLLRWLDAGRQGTMEYMARYGTLRSRPARLLPSTVRVISARMDYLPQEGADPRTVLADPTRGYVARYALGRDYHRMLRKRLQRLAERIAAQIGPFAYRVFVDSAPVLEKPLAQKAGLGWIGKHTNLLNRDAGSYFFLGEIYTDLPLPCDSAPREHCGTCCACIDACPTGAIVAPYQLDARLCISYLTIELTGPIPAPLRPLIGNRIFGCDDCQLVCPWNRVAKHSGERDFQPRHGLDSNSLVALFEWDQETFLRQTEGSPIRRIGYERWQRNLAVALGNGPSNARAVAALQRRLRTSSALVAEHIHWALRRIARQRTQG